MIVRFTMIMTDGQLASNANQIQGRRQHATAQASGAAGDNIVPCGSRSCSSSQCFWRGIARLVAIVQTARHDP